MFKRITGVLAMDPATFREIENDSGATFQALIVVVVSAILSSLGGALGGFLLNLNDGNQGFSSARFIAMAVWVTVAWLLWSAITYLLGTKVFKGEATYGEMLRVIGFAHAPHAFGIFALLPIFGVAITLLVSVWSLGAGVVAIYEGLDLDIGKTIAVALLGFFVYLIGLGLIINFLG